MNNTYEEIPVSSGELPESGDIVVWIDKDQQCITGYITDDGELCLYAKKRLYKPSEMRAWLRKLPPTEPLGVSGIKEKVIDVLRKHLTSDIYFCTRVWEAWQVGTMGEEDFTPVNEDDDFIEELATALIAPLPSPPNESMIEALKQIEQMSDTGDYSTTIVRMKSIATKALATPLLSNKEDIK